MTKAIDILAEMTRHAHLAVYWGLRVKRGDRFGRAPLRWTRARGWFRDSEHITRLNFGLELAKDI